MTPIGPILALFAALAVLMTGRARSAAALDPTRPPKPRRGRITASTRDESGTVLESPRQLLGQIREHADADATLDELTAARLIASERSRGTWAEMTAIVDAELNRAESKGRTLTEHLTSAGTYGKQGGRHADGKRRPASTRRDPKREHLDAARAVIRGQARGIARGAVRFFDPVSQYVAHREWLTGRSDRRHCHPAVILERWTHDRPWDRRGPPCALRSKSGRHLQEWVGDIDGINPLRLMLLRPAEAGADHQRRYREARQRILERYPLANDPAGGTDHE